MSAGLLFVLGIYIGALADRLAERYLRLLQCHIYFIFCKQLTRNNVQMLVTHTIKKRLAVLTVIDYLDRQIFLSHLCQCLSDLIFLAF